MRDLGTTCVLKTHGKVQGYVIIQGASVATIVCRTTPSGGATARDRLTKSPGAISQLVIML